MYERLCAFLNKQKDALDVTQKKKSWGGGPKNSYKHALQQTNLVMDDTKIDGIG